MGAEVMTLSDGTEALVITTGNDIEVHALDVIASYSELFGEPDPGKTVVLMRAAMQTKDQIGLWQPLYESLSGGLGELADAGVSPGQMQEALHAATAAQNPVREKARALRAARQTARNRLAKGGSQNAAEFNAALAGKEGKLMAARTEFLKGVTPPRREKVRTDPSPFEESAVGRPTAELEEGEHGQVSG